ncbi:MAG: murein L,D-transpeptidase catalytic domain family protein, partial [Candidatus Marinimicrobia bacterium]|nr:murein L,D-transpeptidase catalytic domain family protein [Candidatus Neomarinimicrobiota bacterium]
ERGFNHRARRRYIVIHSADYVSESFIRENDRLGRSWGCPALPPDLTQDIIKRIKEGSVLFIYSNDNNYLKNSKLIK